MAEQQLERSMLDGKDREQLHAIAGAMGVKGVTRLRKADLVDAILNAAAGNGTAVATKPKAAAKSATARTTAGNGSDAAPKRAVRSKKASELAAEDQSLEALADEQNALGSGDGEPEITPRPVRRTPGSEGSAGDTSSAPAERSGGVTDGAA